MAKTRTDHLAATRRRLDFVGTVANGFGATEVLVFLLFLAPNTLKHGELRDVAWRTIPVFVVYMAVTLPVGRHYIQNRPLRAIESWLGEGRSPTPSERNVVLSYPRNWALFSFIPWAIAAILFPLINVSAGITITAGMGATIFLGGLTSCSLQYLVVEWIMRPLTARALADGQPPRSTGLGVDLRLAMAWTLATGVPVLGVLVLGALDFTGSRFSRTRLVAAMIFLALVALSVGMTAMVLAARAVVGPLRSIRRALADVEAGDFSARVTVDDGSEIGLLESGFNRMAAGLAERELLRSAFGAFVDPSLTERVLREGTDLAGEEVDVSLLFMDVRGFTTYAERVGARHVFARLNELYRDVVPIVLRHGGHANKFIGDGLLAVFGAPDRLEDHADRAVAAGRDIVDAVSTANGSELRVGVGISSGSVVVGTIGGGGRVEFTVIGDPVNTASRVEEATRETGDDILITDATLRRLADAKAWVERPSIQLRGKAEPVRVFAPAASERGSSPAAAISVAGSKRRSRRS